jgi:hypothetical protein
MAGIAKRPKRDLPFCVFLAEATGIMSMLIKKIQNSTVGTRQRVGAGDLDQFSRFWEAYGNYSPPFWEILLDTVTAESPTGEG